VSDEREGVGMTDIIERKWAALGIIVKMIVGAVVVGGMWHAETRAILLDMIREEWADGIISSEGVK
jgi:hypothetical protein